MTGRVLNFAAGPSALPGPVLERMRAELRDWRGAGLSVAEMSRRSDDVLAIVSKARADLAALLGVPDGYAILFAQGGARDHDAFVPQNLLHGAASADFVVTGDASRRALDAARRVGRARVAASGDSGGFTAIPPREDWQLDPRAAYVHVRLNETGRGIEFSAVPDTGAVPLVADATSALLARPLDVGRFGLVYADAKANFAIEGLTVVVALRDLLDGASAGVPEAFDYAAQAKAGPVAEAIPTFAVYAAGLVFEWLQAQGGLAAVARANAAKAALLYAEIDRSGFYANRVRREDRSRLTVPFVLRDESLAGPFLRGAKAAGLVNLEGHPGVGGARAALYNAMPLAGVQALVDYLREFERTHG